MKLFHNKAWAKTDQTAKTIPYQEASDRGLRQHQCQNCILETYSKSYDNYQCISSQSLLSNYKANNKGHLVYQRISSLLILQFSTVLCTLPLPSLLAWSHPKPCKYRTELYFFSPCQVSLVNCSQNVLSHSAWNLRVNVGYPSFTPFQQILWILLIVPLPVSQSLVSTPSNPIPQFAKVNIPNYKFLCHSTKMSSVFSPTPTG